MHSYCFVVIVIPDYITFSTILFGYNRDVGVRATILFYTGDGHDNDITSFVRMLHAYLLKKSASHAYIFIRTYISTE